MMIEIKRKSKPKTAFLYKSGSVLSGIFLALQCIDLNMCLISNDCVRLEHKFIPEFSVIAFNTKYKMKEN